ncbi:MAG: DegT/DnrJ/EryC1/StrS aminotransferase family protein [Proteobacteria bacterium]|nr:DegT/DnrJ/EryC1/StrS aminotransferase family protein [Pseudomonadota bacterium]
MDYLPFTRPTIDEATIAGVADVLRSGWITSGPQVKAFETKLSEYFGGRPVRSLNSGTGTLEIALAVAGVGAGDEVITTPLSWVATANVVVRAGARPVFVDIDPLTRNINLDLIEPALSAKSKAIIPVDLAGLPVDRDRLYAIAGRHRLRVIEDAAQSMGATWKGRRIGSFGDLISFSFHANKNMTTTEGGCLVVNDEAEADLVTRLRLQGVVRSPDGEMDVAVAGGKYNMTDVAARIGLGQIELLDAFNIKRRELARHYFSCFDRELGCGMPPEDFENSNWHMFQVALPLASMRISRGEFIKAMDAAGIGTGVHYPAMHLFSLYRAMGWKKGDFPHAEAAGASLLTLPLFPAMSFADVERVCDTCARILRQNGK